MRLPDWTARKERERQEFVDFLRSEDYPEQTIKEKKGMRSHDAKAAKGSRSVVLCTSMLD